MNLFTEQPTGADLRDAGIAQALQSAGDGWKEHCAHLFEVFLREQPANEPFKCEHFRHWCAGRIDPPKSDRAFGGIVLGAARKGLIVKVGVSAVSNINAHKAFSADWKKAA